MGPVQKKALRRMAEDPAGETWLPVASGSGLVVRGYARIVERGQALWRYHITDTGRQIARVSGPEAAAPF